MLASLDAELSGIRIPMPCLWCSCYLSHIVSFSVVLVLLTCIEVPAKTMVIITRAITSCRSYILDFPFPHTVCCIRFSFTSLIFCVICQIIKSALESDPVLVKCLWCLTAECSLPVFVRVFSIPLGKLWVKILVAMAGGAFADLHIKGPLRRTANRYL